MRQADELFTNDAGCIRIVPLAARVDCEARELFIATGHPLIPPIEVIRENLLVQLGGHLVSVRVGRGVTRCSRCLTFRATLLVSISAHWDTAASSLIDLNVFDLSNILRERPQLHQVLGLIDIILAQGQLAPIHV